MMSLEIVFVFFRWDYGIFDSALVDCFGVWYFILLYRFCVYDFYLCQGIDLWRSSRWLAVHDVYYLIDWGRSVTLYWHYGTVYE